jgi:hypothetical protein
MGLDVFDVAILAVVIGALAFFAVFIEGDPFIGKEPIQMAVGTDDGNAKVIAPVTEVTTRDVSVKQATTSTVTTTTIKMIFFGTEGAISTLIKTDAGDILVDCGSDPSIMDRLYFAGDNPIRYSFITGRDEEHMGGCTRTFMMMAPGDSFDGGLAETTSAINYEFVVGKKRKIVGNYTFNLGELSGNTIKVANGLIMNMSVGRSRVLLAEGAGINFTGPGGKYDLVEMDGNATFDIDASTAPKYAVLGDYGQEMVPLFRKYGTRVFWPQGGKDAIFVLNGMDVRSLT